jgi:hypothetical protein
LFPRGARGVVVELQIGQVPDGIPPTAINPGFQLVTRSGGRVYVEEAALTVKLCETGVAVA